jgi:hypothetical protein
MIGDRGRTTEVCGHKMDLKQRACDPFIHSVVCSLSSDSESVCTDSLDSHWNRAREALAKAMLQKKILQW